MLTTGRRVYCDDDGNFWTDAKLTSPTKRLPGDYWHYLEWWAGETPNGMLCNLGKHTITLHEDNTITVSPSILVSNGQEGTAGQQWHGFLERGVWREC